MQTSDPRANRERRRPYVMAVVLGTALTALGGAPASAAPDTTLRAVNDISRYCTTCWRNARLHPDVWTDCTQEVLSRLLQRLNQEIPYLSTAEGAREALHVRFHPATGMSIGTLRIVRAPAKFDQ